MPQLYGPNGLQLPNPEEASHFSDNFTTTSNGLSRFAPLSTAIGTQLTSLPQPSPASGFIFTFDPATGLSTQSAESFGPVLGERAETIGRHRLYISFLYQHFSFGSVDGHSLKSIPWVFQHNPESDELGPDDLDYLRTSNRIDLKANQTIANLTFGLTNRIDVSVAIPISEVRFSVTSAMTIVRNSGPVSDYGYYHFFDPSCLPANPPPTAAQLACQAASTQKTFTNSSSAQGLGDITVRLKANVLKREKVRAALGVDTRLPTGDANNFLGTGNFGVTPFMALSYASRISPHVDLGYQWNGDSILSGNILTGAKAAMPSQFQYTAGVDWGFSRHFTIAADLVGERLFSATAFQVGPYTDILGVSHPDEMTTNTVKSSFTMNSFSIGAKLSPVGKLLLAANALIQLDNAGLRSRIVPMVGLSYTF